MLHLQNAQMNEDANKGKSDLQRKLNEISNQPIDLGIEDSLYEFECAIDLLDRLSDALVDDPTTANALNGLHGKFCTVYSDFKSRLMPEIE